MSGNDGFVYDVEMIRRSLFVAAMCLSSLAALPGAARADEPASTDPDALLEQALRDMKDKKLERACPALRESYRQDPRLNVLFHLAECEEQSGKVATAVGLYEKYLEKFDKLSPSEQTDEAVREEKATARRDALARELPKVTLKLPANAPAGSKVTRTSADGLQVALVLNVPLALDPGEVVLRVQAPGHRDVEHRFTVKGGEQKTVELPVPILDRGTERNARVGKPLEPVPSYLPPLENDSQGQRIAAYISGAIGVAGLAAGAISGGYTWGQAGIIEKSCVDQLCTPKGEEAKDTAATYGTVSTVTFAVGGVALAAGVILFVTAPSPSKLSAVPARVVARPSGVDVTWQW